MGRLAFNRRAKRTKKGHIHRDSRSAAQGRDGRKDHQRRTGNDPQGPTGRAAGTYTPSAAWRRLWQRFIAYAFGPYTYDDEGTKP